MAEPDKAPAAQGPAFASAWQAREHRDRQDATKLELAEVEFSNIGESASNERIIDSALNRLSPEERARYKTGAFDDGTSLRLDPATRRAFVDGALATTPKVLTEATARHGGDRKKAFAEMLRADPFHHGPYWKGPEAEILQRLHRDSYRTAEAAPAVSSAPAQSAAPARAPGTVSIDRVDMGQVYARARELRTDPKAREKGIAELKAAGLSPKDAAAIADYARSQMR